MNTFYNQNGIEIPVDIYNDHLSDLINKVYKILCICEQCAELEDYEPYFEYTYKIAILLSGNKVLFKEKRFTNIVAILFGLYEEKVTDHTQVKKIIFECTNSLQKLKKTSE